MAQLTHEEIVTYLEGARDRIADRSHTFAFHSWNACLCGHIYHTIKGDRSVERTTLADPRRDSKYAQVLKAMTATQALDDVFRNGAPELSSEALVVSEALAVSISRAEPDDILARELRQIERKVALELLDKIIKEVKAMDIGKEVRTIQVEPAKVPIPQREERPVRRQIPSREPERTPERTPEKVPAE